jgi:hypothetical protein
MKQKIFFSVIFGFLGIAGFAQDCNQYYNNLENAQLVYKNFDKKDKLSGTSVQKIKQVTRDAGSVMALIESQYFDNKGNSQGSTELHVKCEGGIIYLDMKNYLNQQSMESFKDMEMKIEGGSLEMPSKPKEGEILKGGDMKISCLSNGTPVMTMAISITNRKVEAIQDVTTEAGTFKCYKISFDISTKMMFNVKGKGVEYYNDEVGIVRTESYSASGDFMGYMVLTSIKR